MIREPEKLEGETERFDGPSAAVGANTWKPRASRSLGGGSEGEGSEIRGERYARMKNIELEALLKLGCSLGVDNPRSNPSQPIKLEYGVEFGVWVLFHGVEWSGFSRKLWVRLEL